MSRRVKQLSEDLSAARKRVQRAVAALAPKHRGGETEEFQAAVADQHRIERELALEKGEPAAVEIAWHPRWDLGAPSPHVVSSGHRTFLLYLVSEQDPDWEGTTARMVDPAAPDAEALALVEFKRCYAHRFGGPNDEVANGHPLYGRGLVTYAAHQIANSEWIAAEKRTNAVHAQFSEEHWVGLKHYLLFFHDEVFECLAHDYKVELLRASFRAGVAAATERLFGQ